MLKLAAAKKIIEEIGGQAANAVSISKDRAEARKRLQQLRVALTYGKRPPEAAAINMVIDLFRDAVEKLDPTYINEWWGEVQNRISQEIAKVENISPQEIKADLPEYAVAPNISLARTWKRYLMYPSEKDVDAYFVKRDSRYVVNPRVRQAFRHFKNKFNIDLSRLYMEAANMGNILGFFFVDKDSPTVIMSPTHGVTFLQTLFHELVHASAPRNLVQIQLHPYISKAEKDKARMIHEIAAEAMTKAFHDWVIEDYNPGVIAAIANGLLPLPDTPKWKEFAKKNNIRIQLPAVVRHPIEILAGAEGYYPIVEELSKYKNVGIVRRAWYKMLDMLWNIANPQLYSKSTKEAAMQQQNPPKQLQPRIDQPIRPTIQPPPKTQNEQFIRIMSIIQRAKEILTKVVRNKSQNVA